MRNRKKPKHISNKQLMKKVEELEGLIADSIPLKDLVADNMHSESMTLENKREEKLEASNRKIPDYVC